MIQKPKNQFINLCQDLMFKIFFSNNEKLLLSLLKAFLPLPDKKTIHSFEFIKDKEPKNQKNKPQSAVVKAQKSVDERQSLILTDPSLYTPFVKDKQVVLDLNVQLNTGEKVDVEMQAINKQAFVERTLFYWARLFTKGLEKSGTYDKLCKTYSLIFTKFSISEETKRGFISSFSIRSDAPPHFVLSEYLRMIFVELNRFQPRGRGSSSDKAEWRARSPRFRMSSQDIDKLLDLKSQWCYLLRESGRLTVQKAKLLSTKGEDMALALKFLHEMSADHRRQAEQEALEKQEWDRRAELAYAHDEGFEKGVKDGRAHGHAEGMEQGMQEGMQQGMEKERQAVVLNMLKKQVDMAFISEVTGLAEEEIKKLKNGSCSK